jgi:signal transduction histidine kinase
MDRYVISSSGRLYWFFNSYIYLLGIINFLVLVRLAIFSPSYRLTVAVIVTGQIVARIGYTLYKLQMIGPGESILLTIGVMEAAYAFALLRFHAIDPIAAARKAVLQQMRDGWLVLDLKGRIVDMNPVAAAMLDMPFINVRQKPLTEVMPVRQDFLEKLEKDEFGEVDITLGKDNPARQYNVNLSLLKGRKEELLGRLLLFHDITEQKQIQYQIIEQQKMVATLHEREYLARELHDGIGQIMGYLSVQAQTVLKWLKDGNIGKAEPIIKRIVEVARDAHVDIRESILSLRSGSGQSSSFIPALKKYVERFQANYGIRTELFLADGIDKDTFTPSTEAQLIRVIQEAMNNTRKHSGSHNLKIRMDLNNSKARITITDDGNGFDAESLEQNEGNHFGLVFMRERMAQIGGSLKIDSIPGSGTVLKLEVPVHEQGKEIQ